MLGTVFSYVFGFGLLGYLVLIVVAMTGRKFRRYAKPKRRR